MAEGNKFLDHTGLSHLWEKIKARFVQKAGDTMTGSLTAPAMAIHDISAPVLCFKAEADSEWTGMVFHHIATRRMALRGKSPAGYLEDYYIPTPDETAGNKAYSLLTTKSAVAVNQGGTSASTPEGALNNLGGVAKSAFTKKTAVVEPVSVAAHAQQYVYVAAESGAIPIAAYFENGSGGSAVLIISSPMLNSGQAVVRIYNPNSSAVTAAGTMHVVFMNTSVLS